MDDLKLSYGVLWDEPDARSVEVRAKLLRWGKGLVPLVETLKYKMAVGCEENHGRQQKG